MKSVTIIEPNEWNGLVNDTYNKPYHFQQQDGCKQRGVFYLDIPTEPEDYDNETVPLEINGDKMGVSFESWLKTDPQEHAKEMNWIGWKLRIFWERNFYPHVSMIANDLHAKGLLPAGNYAIDIDW